MQLGQRAVLRLVLRRVVGPQVVEREAPRDNFVFQCLRHRSLPGRGEPSIGIGIAIACREDMEAAIGPRQRAQAHHQVSHLRRNADALDTRVAAVLLRSHRPDLACNAVDLRQREVQELNAS